MTAEPVIKLDNVSVKLGARWVLQHIHLHVLPREIVSIVGPNGGGKTTLIKTILGFIAPNTGTVQVLGKTAKEITASGRVGYLPQINRSQRFFPVSAWDVAAMSRHAKSHHSFYLNKNDRQHIHHALDRVGATSFKNTPFGQLSGGQQQRVLIARALAGDPELLILDEPSTGLDAVAQDSFYHLLRNIRDTENLTILMVSHDIGTVSTLVDKIACLNKEIHYHGPAQEGMTSEILQKVFGSHMQVLVHDENCESCGHKRK